MLVKKILLAYKNHKSSSKMQKIVELLAKSFASNDINILEADT